LTALSNRTAIPIITTITLAGITGVMSAGIIQTALAASTGDSTVGMAASMVEADITENSAGMNVLGGGCH
jgi:hypothetical protein